MVDGLDEYNIPVETTSNGDQGTTYSKQQKGFEEIVEFFLKLKEHPGIKLCLASRPLITFQDELSVFPHLYVHDLTENDMRKFVEDGHAKRTAQLKLLEDRDSRNRIANTLQEKANGVFLWVRLVVDRILQRLRNRDDLRSIESELQSLPDDLGGPTGLYALMLRDDVLPENRAEGIRILYHLLNFGLVDDSTNINYKPNGLMLEIAEHLSGNQEDLVRSMRQLYSKLLSEGDIVRRLERFEGRVNACCAGLAESYNPDSTPPPASLRYRFIHETVSEFLNEGLSGDWNLQETAAGRDEICVRQAGAYVMSIFLIIPSLSDLSPYGHFSFALQVMRKLNQQGFQHLSKLRFDLLDETRYICSLIHA